MDAHEELVNKLRWTIELSSSDDPDQLARTILSKFVGIAHENAILREALKPFAKMADEVDEWQKGSGDFEGSFNADDLRRARTALSGAVKSQS